MYSDSQSEERTGKTEKAKPTVAVASGWQSPFPAPMPPPLAHIPSKDATVGVLDMGTQAKLFVILTYEWEGRGEQAGGERGGKGRDAWR